MSLGSLFETKTVNLNEILSNGKVYRVPLYQRDYSWTQDNWEDLWSDTSIAEEEQSVHYMGSIVLQQQPGKEFLIIDGQQRLATLSLLALAVIKTLKNLVEAGVEPTQNEDRVNLLTQQYIGYKSPSSLTHSSKLFLNTNNNNFYQDRLLRFEGPIEERKTKKSNKLLWQAYQYFLVQLEQRFGSLKDGGAIAGFLADVVGERMSFIQITVQDELSAYTVFETLNSRGVELTPTDLLKNYLFSIVAKTPSDLERISQKWNCLIEIIDLHEFPTFLRHYLSATTKRVRKEDLFREMKRLVNTPKEVLELLDELEGFAYWYAAFDNPGDVLWRDLEGSSQLISVIKMFKITQWKPLAMVAVKKLKPGDFMKLLNAIINVSFRFNVICQKQANVMEVVYSESAIELYKNPQIRLKDIVKNLKKVDVPDAEFRQFFATTYVGLKNNEKKLARYILYALEGQKGGQHKNFETDPGTIEHILPQMYTKQWQAFFTDDDFERSVNMLGNLTLLEAKKNNDAADLTFAEKKKIYAQSQYQITKEIVREEWNPQAVMHRQAELAKIATAVWKLA